MDVVKLLQQGGQQYLSLDLVKLYHGIVKKECMEDIKSLTGKYFGGLSPDIYIATALSLTIDKLVVIDWPLTISGICNKSGSADSATGRHTGKLEDAPHFRGHERYEWSELVPRFYSVETIWADSVIAAINDLNKSELLNEFNVAALTSCCQKKYYSFNNIIMENYYNWLQKTGKARIKLESVNAIKLSTDFLKRVIRRLKRKKGDIARINKIPNVIEAGKVLQQRFDEIGIDNKSIKRALDKVVK
jgi:hypothetical protein